MIKLENLDIYGWEAAIRGMRNPKNSWDKSDSKFEPCEEYNGFLGENDLKLMKTLANAGSDHGKFMRMITVTVDITAPLYWWKEFDTYKVGTVANSCSTMHKIHAKEFTLDDFSHEKLFSCYGDPSMNLNYAGEHPKAVLLYIIHVLNTFRYWYNETKDERYWWQMIQLLPSSYNQKRTVQLNYAVLKNMYFARRDHKLDEWRIFCKWIEDLPYSELIIGEE